MLQMNEGSYCIVTGGYTGIGKEIARGLMEGVKGSHVVITSRSRSRCEEAKKELEEQANGQASCSCYELDLADLASVKRFSTKVSADLKRRKSQLDILVHNAGIWTSEEGPSGLEDLTFLTNHLGPFYLTKLLLPLMRPGSRIVNVSSRAHFMGSLSFQKDGSLVQVQRSWSNKASLGFVTYARSKLCNVLFTAELQRRLKDRGIVSVATSPGPVNTSLFRSLPSPLQFLLKPLAHRLFRTPAEGAASSVYAALSPDLNPPANEGVIFIHDNKKCAPSTSSQDEELASKLWNISEQLIDCMCI